MPSSFQSTTPNDIYKNLLRAKHSKYTYIASENYKILVHMVLFWGIDLYPSLADKKEYLFFSQMDMTTQSQISKNSKDHRWPIRFFCC